MNKKHKTPQDNDDVEALLHRLEGVLNYVDHSRAICNTMFDTIRRDCEYLIDDIKTHRGNLDIDHITHSDRNISPETSFQDASIDSSKLQKTHFILTKYPDGATADEIAHVMRRHRTTVSTYLNQLVKQELAEKERIGHEIYYRAVMNKKRGSSE